MTPIVSDGKRIEPHRPHRPLTSGGPLDEGDYLAPSARTWAEDRMARLDGTRGRSRLPDMRHCALLLVDLQRIFVDPASPAYLSAWNSAGPVCRVLLADARRFGVPVLWSRHVHPDSDEGGSIQHFFGRLIRGHDPLSELSSDCGVAPDDRVIHKSRHPVFYGTNLSQILLDAGIFVLIIAGVQAPLCVTATAVWAGATDLIPVVVADAVAAKTQQEHEAALVTLASGLAHVATSSEIAAAWAQARAASTTPDDPTVDFEN